MLQLILQATITISATILPSAKVDGLTLTSTTTKGVAPPTVLVDAGGFSPVKDLFLASNARVSVPEQKLPEQSRPAVVVIFRFD